MNADIQINNSASPQARYVTWTPSPCRIRMTNSSGAIGSSVSVTLSSVAAANAGAVQFRTTVTGALSATLSLPLPTNGTSVSFFVVGRFGHPSSSDGDVRIEARVAGNVIGQVRVMVRIRKNANTLSAGEISRFVTAFGQLNNQGAGRFADFRNMHQTAGLPEAHGLPGFLPWHRAYLLDLERELQAIDSSVALPYWRFDQPAPNLFTPAFLGASNANGNVQFAPGNLLQFWKTDNVTGVNRTPQFNPITGRGNVINEAQTLALGGAGNQYSAFRLNMEGDPHGLAHTSFFGFIRFPATAARDPLFFLLHANVDRLWAKWQRQFARFDPATSASFNPNGSRIGHNLPDTMWPWNGVTASPRPPVAPGGSLAVSPTTAAPGTQPRVRDCLDFQGRLNNNSRHGFDYDDVQGP